jgi:hypothetical protein
MTLLWLFANLYAEKIMGWSPSECHPVLRLLWMIVGVQVVPGREWMTLLGCREESLVPNHRENISGIPPGSITWSEGRGQHFM